MKRYRIDRVYNSEHRWCEGDAPTLDEAHHWIVERCKRAGIVGLRLQPRDFDAVDTWEET